MEHGSVITRNKLWNCFDPAGIAEDKMKDEKGKNVIVTEDKKLHLNDKWCCGKRKTKSCVRLSAFLWSCPYMSAQWT